MLIYSLLADPNPPVLLRTLKGLLGSEERLGFSAQGLPDLNQDGKAEVLIGAPGTETTAGKVYLYSGADIVSSSSSITPLCTITDPAVATFFGHALTFLDDDNKDGKIEFVASAPGASLNRGEIRFYQFTTGIGCEEVAKVTGSATGDFLGRPLGADFCSPSTQRVLTAGTTTTNGSGNIVGSAILFSPLPTVTPTATPTATQTATATPTLTPPPQINPSKASLSFRISETGEFKITSIYDQEPGNNCSFILYSRIQVGNRLLEAEKISSGVTSDQAQEKNKIIKILNFPSAEKISGQIPIVHMLLRTTCDSKTFDSNIFARYMNCGLPDISVSLSSWITTLKNALSTAEVQTSIRSDRMLKLIRLKKRRFRK